MYYIFIGFAVTIIVANIVNTIFHKTTREHNPDLFVTFVANRLKRRKQIFEVEQK